jgi:hypothetical protein
LLRIEEHCDKLGDRFAFFNNKHEKFKKGFCAVFGSDVRDEKDIFEYVEDFRVLFWDKLENGKVIDREEIYELRGRSVLFVRKDGYHHWQPESQGGKKVIRIPIDFHAGWHAIHFNLWKRKHFQLFWRKIFTDEALDDYYIIRTIAYQIVTGKLT